MTARGLFVTFEGGEGSGKTAQAADLVAHLESRGARAVPTREPGGTPLAERIRDVLLFAREIPLSAEAQALLFSAARAQLARDVISPALADGAHVVAERFFDSTFAYQGYGHGADLELLREVTRFAVGDLRPDLTFLLDLPIEVGLQRARERSTRWDRFEVVDEAFHRRVRDGYLTLARSEPERFSVLDADRPRAEIAADVRARFDAALARRGSALGARR